MGLEDDIKSIDRFAEVAPRSVLISFEQAVDLSDEKFAEYYLALMRTKRLTHMWWRGVVPECAECGDEIAGSRELRMYDSQPYHPQCFAKVYDPEGKDELMQKYFQRVLELP